MVAMVLTGNREVTHLEKKKRGCAGRMFQIKVAKLLSGPAPDPCQVSARHKMGLKEISGSTSKMTVQPALQKDEDEAKEKLKQAELQVGTV